MHVTHDVETHGWKLWENLLWTRVCNNYRIWIWRWLNKEQCKTWGKGRRWLHFARSSRRKLMDRFLRESLMFKVFHNAKLSNAIEKNERKKSTSVPNAKSH